MADANRPEGAPEAPPPTTPSTYDQATSREHTINESSRVDEASFESFPASDVPGWTGNQATRSVSASSYAAAGAQGAQAARDVGNREPETEAGNAAGVPPNQTGEPDA